MIGAVKISVRMSVCVTHSGEFTASQHDAVVGTATNTEAKKAVQDTAKAVPQTMSFSASVESSSVRIVISLIP